MRVITKKKEEPQLITPKPSVEPAQPLYGNYTIRSGDNLTRIASLNKTTLQDLLKLNPLIKNPDIVRPGTNLTVPSNDVSKVLSKPVATGRYVVLAGDNMTTIARRNNTTVEDILRDNPHIKNPNVVRVGDELKVSEPEPYKPKVRSFSEIQKLEEELNGKSDTEIIHHYYTSKNLDKNYIIDDKKGSLAIYNRGRLIKRWKAAHGKNAGSDDMTVTYKDVDGEIKNGEGNLSTPAGYYLSKYSDSRYHGVPSYIRYTPDMVKRGTTNGIPSSIHGRNNIAGNTITNGCTGMHCRDLVEMDKIIPRDEYVDTYILPVEEGNKFYLRNGEILFRSNDLSLTPAYNTIAKTPIEEFKFEPAKGTGVRQRVVAKSYMNSLAKNKESLQDDLGINNDTYINLSKLAYGILGAESTFGMKNTEPGNIVRAVTKALNLRETSPDIYSKFNTFHVRGDNNSVGLTLMRLKNLSESSLKLLEKYNITKEDLVNRPDKAAVATLIHLADLYKNTGRNFDKVLSLWNNGKYYSLNVKKYADTVEAYLKYKEGGLIIQ